MNPRRQLLAVLIGLTVLIAGTVTGPTASAASSRVTIDAIGTADHYKGVVRAIGRVSPAPASRTPVYLQIYSSGSWRNVGVGYTTGSAVAVTAKVGGSVLRYRLKYGTAVSVSRTFNHFVWRGIFNRPVLGTGGQGARLTTMPADIAGNRSGGRLTARYEGSSWVDVNTSGCLRLDAMFQNNSSVSWTGNGAIYNGEDGNIRTSLWRGSTVLASFLMPYPYGRDEVRNFDLRGAPRLKLTIQAVAPAAKPDLTVELWVLCNNNGDKKPTPAASQPQLAWSGGIHTWGDVDYYGTPFIVVGFLTRLYGPHYQPLPVGGQSVRVLRSRQGANQWSTLTTLRTNAGGWFRLTVPRTVPYDYLLERRIGNTWSKLMKLTPVIQRRVIFDRLTTSGATGRVFPAPPKGHPVYLQRYDAGGWRVVGTWRATGGTTVSIPARLTAANRRYRLFAPFHPKPPYAAGGSGVRTL